MLRVLIVEDSPIIRNSLMKAVERAGDSVIVSGEAGNGKEALDWLEAHYADLCLTDIRMPVLGGLELISELRQRCPWMVSMIISSYDEFEYAKKGIQLEAVDYILKPVKQSILNDSLTRAADRLNETRMNTARELLMKRLPHHRETMNQWVEHIRTHRTETMPLLIVETLELLERLVGESYYLLNALSMNWLQCVLEELLETKLDIKLEEGKDLGLGDRVMTRNQLRFYFRLCAVRRLEEGAQRLLQSMNLAKDSQSTRLVVKVKAYIAEQLSEKLSIQSLADYAEVSRTHLANLFKQDTGYTVNQYIIEVRMRKARDLLLHTSLRSYEIAGQVGYEDVIYFAQLFKKHFGIAPMEYKKRMET